VLKLFSLIDVDGSKTIDKEETLKFWSKNFAKLNTTELFDQVDKNNDGSIQIDEWIEFWTLVYNSGHDEEEISNEVNLIN
jgi:Ca2+-binding EF-hand superfamily protein